jgi:hypothetical protein
MSRLTARRFHDENLQKLRHAAEGTGNALLNKVSFFAGQAFVAGTLEQAEEQLQGELFRIVTEEWTSPHPSAGAKATIESGWSKGMKEPLEIISSDDPVAALAELDGWLRGESTLTSDEVLDRVAVLTVVQLQDRRCAIIKKLGGWKSGAFDQELARRRRWVPVVPPDPATLTLGEVRRAVEELLDRDHSEAQTKEAENLIWNYLRSHSRVFFCEGCGYLLPHDGDGVPIAITRDGQDFDLLLIGFGIHPGSPTRDRIGRFIDTGCFREGVRTETRLSFHYDPRTFTAYAARDRGVLIRITRWGLEEVPNGTDDQLFIFPPAWQPLLTRPLEEVGGADDFPKSDLLKRALFPDGFLVRHLFQDANFEIRTMTAWQVRVLVMACALFLMMPGVVSERALLQALGPSGSGKTFMLFLLGRLLMGPKFEPRSLPEDVREFETQVINSAYIVYDNVSHVPREIRDRFCQAVTGLEVVRRVLFTDTREIRERSKATLAISAIESPLPELEHQNRTVTMSFLARDQGYVASEELLKAVDKNRDVIVLDLLRRVCLAIEALWAQRDYIPRVNVRLASIATFILRIARHEGWEEFHWSERASGALALLNAWGAEQMGYSMQEDDVSTAIFRWLGRDDWKPNVELTATVLNQQLCAVMSATPRGELSWRGSHLVLAKIIARNLKVYEERFGLERKKSTLRTSRAAHTYWFNPKADALAEAKQQVQYELNILYPDLNKKK